MGVEYSAFGGQSSSNVQYITVQYSTVHYSIVQYSTVQYMIMDNYQNKNCITVVRQQF